MPISDIQQKLLAVSGQLSGHHKSPDDFGPPLPPPPSAPLDVISGSSGLSGSIKRRRSSDMVSLDPIFFMSNKNLFENLGFG